METAYRLDLSEQACVDELARFATNALGSKSPAAAFVTQHYPDPERTTFRALSTANDKLRDDLRWSMEWLPTAVQRRLSRSPPLITTTSQLFGPSLMTQVKRAGVPEFAGLLCPTSPKIVYRGIS